MRLVSLLILPIVAGLAALSRPVVNLLFQHGETGASEARSIAIVLLGYLPGTLFAAYDQLLIYAFYARKRTWTPVLVGVAGVFIYFAVATILADRYGALGLAIANSAQFIGHTLILGWLARGLVASIWRRSSDLIAVAFRGALLSTAAAVAVWFVIDRLGSGLAIEVISVGLAVGAALAVYALLMRSANLPEVLLILSRVGGGRFARQDPSA